ncbi:3-dehydroquinate synthase [Pseudobacillus wudalianchiensis]|uniref:3-dehydroquinate synthase n=1 Tax=Pseudobacillus wudalianchiensis TaxID=1743143 RepID=A0A1B9B9I7_9BACI|nr:3-dehydroquinate synthase [Bacillus wudalianchiensis]OCA92755.1 3-dehydroquinate synthase [Bacillus wudalianchiensis]
MRELTIETPDQSYPVYVGEGALSKLTELFAGPLKGTTKLLVIADELVASLHSEALQQALPPQLSCEWLTVPNGEAAKTFSSFENCLTFALEKGLDRKSCILAFGGGATGDLAGYVAASYMRGISFIQIPTTILAHDSAVGGKTAINHPLGKNMIGHFHQPAAVVFDTRFLQTLPEQQVRSGFAEVIKHALIADPAFLAELKANVKSFKDLSADFLAYCLEKGIQIKGEIVGKDVKEQGVRAYLNFGHTYGHALEAKLGYGRITHGEAVAAGMVFALHVSERKAGLSFDLKEFIVWLKGLGYPLDLNNGLPFEELYTLMARDKKTIGETIRFVLLQEVGRPVMKEMSRQELEEADRFMREEAAV